MDNRQKIKMVLFDVDGVITDGRKYMDGSGVEFKAIALKDLDAFHMFKEAGYKIGCITGEDTAFSRQFQQMDIMDFVKIGCKQKEDVLKEVEKECHVTPAEI